MRLAAGGLLLVALFALCGCAVSLSSPASAAKWATGFWYWQGSSTENAWSGGTLDVLFVHAGNISNDAGPRGSDWYVNSNLPADLPAAREYWFVFRYQRQGVPAGSVVPMIASEVSALRRMARERHLNFEGVQLDVDSPTAVLDEYARFLREVRKALPEGVSISITALLDWFRPGTAIADVIAAADEFVPQFYDIADRDSFGGGEAIAAPIDAARWGPIFNRFGKRFRVGVSTFGRARTVSSEPVSSARHTRVRLFGDLAPIDVAANPAFEMRAGRDKANELVVNYRAVRKVRIGYNDFNAGDIVQFILSTPEAVRAAMESAHSMGGHCAGVLFFRWPTSEETLTMQPDEVARAAGLSIAPAEKQGRIDIINGHCAAVECVDVYLEGAAPFSPNLVRYRIRSSTNLEYFLPEQNLPVRLTGPAQLDFSLPPYCGRGRIYLGRAVSSSPADFTVEQEP